MAFVNFALAFSVWVAPTGGNGWFGKRFKDTISPPQVGRARPAGSPNPSGTPYAGWLMGYVRGEMTNLFNGVREPSIWFGLSGILYLLAARHHSASRFDG